MEENIFFSEAMFEVSFVPARNNLLEVSNLSTKRRCESCLILGMSMLTIFSVPRLTRSKIDMFKSLSITAVVFSIGVSV